MTAMSSVTSATTPRSCVISTIAIPSSSRSRREQLEDLRLDGHVERGRRLVGDQQPGLVRERHRDHRALAHPARVLVRVAVDAPPRLGDPDEPEQLDRPLARRRLRHVLVDADRLDDLAADAVEGVQRGQRVLEDHRDRGRRARARSSSSLSGSRSRPSNRTRPETSVARAARQPEHGEHADRLARARLAHDAERAAGLDGEVDAADGLHDTVLGAEVDAQVLELEQGARRAARGRRRCGCGRGAHW